MLVVIFLVYLGDLGSGVSSAVHLEDTGIGWDVEGLASEGTVFSWIQGEDQVTIGALLWLE